MTSQERNSIYKEARYYLYLSDTFGICGAINCVYKELRLNKICDITEFPEIFKHMPEGLTLKHFWFKLDDEGKKKRFEILNQAILETDGNI